MQSSLENLPPFYVGQKVVCIKNHSSGVVLKDKTYTVTSVLKICCGFRIGVGIEWNYGTKNVCCSSCTSIRPPDKEWMLSPCLFAPLQESVFPTLTLSRVIEKELQLTSMNQDMKQLFKYQLALFLAGVLLTIILFI